MARIYETVVIVDAMIPEEAIESEFDAIEKRILDRCNLIKKDRWGKRKLAYEIKGRSHGEYAVFYYESEDAFSKDMERSFRINENILRWLTIVDNPAGIPEDKEPAEEKETEVKAEAAVEEKTSDDKAAPVDDVQKEAAKENVEG